MTQKKEMSATAFKRWLKTMNYSHSKASRELGSSRSSVIKWSKVGAPKTVMLACHHLMGVVNEQAKK